MYMVVCFATDNKIKLQSAFYWFTRWWHKPIVIVLQYFYRFFFWILQYVLLFELLFLDFFRLDFDIIQKCAFLLFFIHSATQTPLSHYVRSSDWVETKCFRSKVPQRQTHSWPRLKSKLSYFSTNDTKRLNVDTDVLFLRHQTGDCGAAAI